LFPAIGSFHQAWRLGETPGTRVSFHFPPVTAKEEDQAIKIPAGPGPVVTATAARTATIWPSIPVLYTISKRDNCVESELTSGSRHRSPSNHSQSNYPDHGLLQVACASQSRGFSGLDGRPLHLPVMAYDTFPPDHLLDSIIFNSLLPKPENVDGGKNLRT
jgi:hypothetical protein